MKAFPVVIQINKSLFTQYTLLNDHNNKCKPFNMYIIYFPCKINKVDITLFKSITTLSIGQHNSVFLNQINLSVETQYKHKVRKTD